MTKRDAFVNFEQFLSTENNEEKIAEKFTSLLNCCSGGPIKDFTEYFLVSLERERLTELFSYWIEMCAEDTYCYDERNHASHLIAKEITNDSWVRMPLVSDRARKICIYVARDHRTLQQNFTRLSIEWLYKCGLIAHKAYLPYI